MSFIFSKIDSVYLVPKGNNKWQISQYFTIKKTITYCIKRKVNKALLFCM